MSNPTTPRFYFIKNGNRSVKLTVSPALCAFDNGSGMISANRSEIANALRYARAKMAKISCIK